MTDTLPIAGRRNATETNGVHHWLYVMSHTDPRYGGLSSAVPSAGLSIAAEHPFSMSLAAFCSPGEEFRPLGYEGERMTFWPASRREWFGNRKLREAFTVLVRQNDGVHVHGLWEQSTAVASHVAQKNSKPYVLSAHGMLEPWALAQHVLRKKIYAALVEKKIVSGAAVLHALTIEEAKQYRRFGARNPIAVIPNAVRRPKELDSSTFFAKYPHLKAKRIVLFLARLNPKKGADLLVEAWAKVGKLHPDAHLLLAGPDSDGLASQLQATATSLGIADQISFPGMFDQAMKWSALAAAECFVLPSHSEGLSMGVLEAMAAGVPVLLTHNCNMPLISERSAGWEIAPRVASLAEQLDAVLRRSPEENRATGQRGAELAAEVYSPERTADQMAEVYAYAAGGQKPSTTELIYGEIA